MLLSVLANMAYVTALEQDVLRAHSCLCTLPHLGMGAALAPRDRCNNDHLPDLCHAILRLAQQIPDSNVNSVGNANGTSCSLKVSESLSDA